MKLTNLHTNFLGRTNFYYDKIDSTQTEVWRLYEKGYENGTVVMAGIQEKGIGTHGRIWHTDEENNIAFSLLIKPDIEANLDNEYEIDNKIRKSNNMNGNSFESNGGSYLCVDKIEIDKLNGITLEIAEIIVEIFKNKYGVQISIKEPNDLMCNDKKIGGILTETKVINENVKAVVIGIGINTAKTVFSEDIKDTASSIKLEFGVEVKVQEFVEEFCNKFENVILRRII